MSLEDEDEVLVFGRTFLGFGAGKAGIRLGTGGLSPSTSAVSVSIAFFVLGVNCSGDFAFGVVWVVVVDVSLVGGVFWVVLMVTWVEFSLMGVVGGAVVCVIGSVIVEWGIVFCVAATCE